MRKFGSIINSIFDGCINLKSLDLSGFQFIEVSLQIDIFKDLKNLKTLNLSNVNIYDKNNNNQISNLLFTNNKNLESLDLSNFKINSKINMEYLFSNLFSLKYINMYNFQSENITNLTGIGLFKYFWI